MNGKSQNAFLIAPLIQDISAISASFFFEQKVYKWHEIEAFGIGLMLIMQQPSYALYVQERNQWIIVVSEGN